MSSTIPSKAKKVFEGVIFDVYQWQQEQFDGSYKTFEVLKRSPSVQIIAKSSKDELIILKEKQPQDNDVGYSLIGGGCDSEDEDPKEAARRELLEETGMQCEELEFFEISRPGGKIHWPCYYFIAHNCSKIRDQELDSGEQIEVEFVSFSNFCEIVEHKKFRNQYFRNMLFRILHTQDEFDKLKEKLRIKE